MLRSPHSALHIETRRAAQPVGLAAWRVAVGLVAAVVVDADPAGWTTFTTGEIAVSFEVDANRVIPRIAQPAGAAALQLIAERDADIVDALLGQFAVIGGFTLLGYFAAAVLAGLVREIAVSVVEAAVICRGAELSTLIGGAADLVLKRAGPIRVAVRDWATGRAFAAGAAALLRCAANILGQSAEPIGVLCRGPATLRLASRAGPVAER